MTEQVKEFLLWARASKITRISLKTSELDITAEFWPLVFTDTRDLDIIKPEPKKVEKPNDLPEAYQDPDLFYNFKP